jgi:hypothetical protein
MNIANYLNPEFDRYPLSAESFDFIQEQINLLQPICELYDLNYILRKPADGKAGIIVIKGEVMPLRVGNENRFISVTTRSINVDADGVSYKGVRTERYADYTATGIGTESYPSSSFNVAPSIKQTRQVPGQIIDLIVSANPGETVTALINRLFLPSGQGRNPISYRTPQGTATNVDLSNLWICNGSGSIPNLRGRLCMMTDGTQAVGTTAGAASGNPAASNNSYNISLASGNLPSHGHTLRGSVTGSGTNSHTHTTNAFFTDSAGSHVHSGNIRYATNNSGSSRIFASQINADGLTSRNTGMDYAGSHSHRVPATTTSSPSSTSVTLNLSHSLAVETTGQGNSFNILNPVVYVLKCMVGNKGY